MKYLSQGGFQSNPLMRLTLGLALLLLAGFWVSNLAIYFVHMSLDPASVVAYYRGDEERFLPPRSAQSLLEVTHAHLPMFALVLLLLTHLLIFSPMRNATKVAFILTAFLSAALFEAAGWMIRFGSPAWAWLKVVSFVALQLVLGWLIASLAWTMLRGSANGTRRGAGETASHRDAP